MKKGLLATTALVGAGALGGGAALAAEAPEWKLGGNMNFQLYWADPENSGTKVGAGATKTFDAGATKVWLDRIQVWDTNDTGFQEHGWYFGVDEAELALNVSGAADNGLKYGFKIEIQVNTNDTKVADEARIQLSGDWGTVQLGDEDGAEDIMNYGGENLMGATGGFDGDQDDYLFRAGGDVTHAEFLINDDQTTLFHITSQNGNSLSLAAPSYPTIAGDTSDKTKITYYSPRFSGFQVGASITPTPNNGDNFKSDGSWENHYGLGANYDATFGNLHLQASAVFSSAANADEEFEDYSAWSVGGIVGFGPFSIGANYTDNSDSGQPLVWDDGTNRFEPTGIETSSWNVAASFDTGPMSFAVGYFAGNIDWGTYYSGAGLNGALGWVDGGSGEGDFTTISLTADYKMAPGLAVYAEYDMIDDETGIEPGVFFGGVPSDNSMSLFILGVNVSF